MVVARRTPPSGPRRDPPSGRSPRKAPDVAQGRPCQRWPWTLACGTVPRGRETRSRSMKVRVAVVQATPVVLDAAASRGQGLRPDRRGGGRAGRASSRCPRCSSRSIPARAGRHRLRALHRGAGRAPPPLWDNAVDVPGPLTERLGPPPAAPRLGGHRGQRARLQRARGRSGTRSCGSLPTAPSPASTASSMPTLHERVFWGQGAGDDLDRPGHRHRAPRRADLLGELHARRPPAPAPRGRRLLPRPDRRRPRHLGGGDADLRLRGGRVRALAGAVPAPRSLPRRLPAAPTSSPPARTSCSRATA